MILATGHLGRHEIVALVRTAKEIGLRKVVVTHAEFPSQSLSAAEQAELADMGALIEHCFTTMHTGKASGTICSRAFARSLPSAASSQPTWGKPSILPWQRVLPCLPRLCSMRAFSSEQIHHMAVTNPASLVE